LPISVLELSAKHQHLPVSDRSTRNWYPADSSDQNLGSDIIDAF
jgi:hypothetical protein